MKRIKNIIFTIIESSETNNKMSRLYDSTMFIVIILSLIPLTQKTSSNLLISVEVICVNIFIIDYILRLITADLKLKKGVKSYFLYPLTFWGFIDLLSIMPTFRYFSALFNSVTALRGLRALRILKLLKYSKNFRMVLQVAKKNKSILMSLLAFAVGYVLFTGLFMFNVEPNTFDNYFESVYWATTTLTTVGYGDIYPLSDVGRVVSMISSFFGIAMIALPSGVITAGFINEIKDKN